MGYSRAACTTDRERVRAVTGVLWAVLGLNLAVAAAKWLYGHFSGSIAMQADGFHSLFDGASNVIALVGLAAAVRPADSNHPYGHDKYETLSAAAIGALLLFSGWRVGSAAWDGLVGQGEPARVDALSFGVMAATLAVNVGVWSWERRAGTRLGSELLLADSRHTGSDVLVSLGVVGGLAAVRLGWPAADPLIALVVAGVIFWTAWQVLRQADLTLTDSARLPVQEVSAVTEAVPGVLGCHSVRTRGGSASVHVDLHVQVDPEITVAAGHRIAEAVERELCLHFPGVTDVIAHLEPFDEYQARKTAAERREAEISNLKSQIPNVDGPDRGA